VTAAGIAYWPATPRMKSIRPAFAERLDTPGLRFDKVTESSKVGTFLRHSVDDLKLGLSKQIVSEQNVVDHALAMCTMRNVLQIPGRQGHIRVRQWADDCDVPYERLPTLPWNQSEAIWRLPSDLHKHCGFFVLGIDAVDRKGQSY